jgi:polyisoprenoid-binding protein YceI
MPTMSSTTSSPRSADAEDRPTARPWYRRPRNWIIAGVVAVILVAVVAPWAYINFIKEDAAPRFELETSDDVAAAQSDTTDAADAADTAGDTTTTSADAASGIEGAWTVTTGTEAGYRVGEVLFGQDTEATGRTAAVTGSLTVEGTTISAATFEVDMTTVTSDESRRDGQFHGRIMSTAQFPTATFTLTEPITLDEVPAELEPVAVTATGDLTLRGVTQPVTFEIQAQLNTGRIEVTGAIPVTFADYQIPDASGGPATVKDNGEVEFHLFFARA